MGYAPAPSKSSGSIAPAFPARVEPLYCPVCPGDQPKLRRNPTDLVCGDCYRKYTDEAAIAFASGQFQNLFSWVAGRAPAILIVLEEKLATAKAEVEALQKSVGDETFATLKQNAGDRLIPKEIWDNSFRIKKAELWRAQNGNFKFAVMKTLESRIALLKSVLEKAKTPPPVPPATVVDTVAVQPAAAEAAPVTATPPEKPADVSTPPADVKPPAKTPKPKKQQ